MIHDDEDLVENLFLCRRTETSPDHSPDFNLEQHSWVPAVWNRHNSNRVRQHAVERREHLATLQRIEAFPSSFPEPGFEWDKLGREMTYLVFKNTVFLLSTNGYRGGIPTKRQGTKTVGSRAESRCVADQVGDKVLCIYYEMNFVIIPSILHLEIEEVDKLVQQVAARELGQRINRPAFVEGNSG